MRSVSIARTGRYPAHPRYRRYRHRYRQSPPHQHRCLLAAGVEREDQASATPSPSLSTLYRSVPIASFVLIRQRVVIVVGIGHITDEVTIEIRHLIGVGWEGIGIVAHAITVVIGGLVRIVREDISIIGTPSISESTASLESFGKASHCRQHRPCRCHLSPMRPLGVEHRPLA